MKYARISLSAILVLIFVSSSLTYAHVPRMINYQGKMTTPQGALVDTTISMTFAIYTDGMGTDSLWSETQVSVTVEKGVFSVLLGSVSPIPDTAFTGDVRYLGVKVGDDPEMTPRREIVSVAYAYRAASVQSGGFDCSDCDDRFVNVQGPDTVLTASETALLGRASGSSGSFMRGIEGYGDNSSTGAAYGGRFLTSSSGTGDHYGVWAGGYGSSSNNTVGSYAYGSNSSTGTAVGAQGYASNTSTGAAFGGIFSASLSGTGLHVGIKGEGQGSSSSVTYGVSGSAWNTSTGYAYGGHFSASDPGTGSHYGIWAGGYSTTFMAAYGSYGYAQNTSSGVATGCIGYAQGTSTGNTYGSYGYAQNISTGTVYAGYFHADSSGTGTKYGVYAEAPVDEGYAGYFDGDVYISDSLIVSGAKSAAVRVGDGEYRLLYSQESPEVWFEDFGEAQLVNGKMVVEIDPLFARTVNTDIAYHVFLTPGGECNGLCVVNKTPTSFEVRELQSGDSNVAFSYRIVAKRKGFENIRLARMGGPTPEQVAREQAKNQADLELERTKMEQEKQKMEEERARILEE